MQEIIGLDGKPADKRGVLGNDLIAEAQANVRKKEGIDAVRRIALNEGAGDMVTMISGCLSEIRDEGGDYIEIDTLEHLMNKFYEAYTA